MTWTGEVIGNTVSLVPTGSGASGWSRRFDGVVVTGKSGTWLAGTIRPPRSFLVFMALFVPFGLFLAITEWAFVGVGYSLSTFGIIWAAVASVVERGTRASLTEWAKVEGWLHDCLDAPAVAPPGEVAPALLHPVPAGVRPWGRWPLPWIATLVGAIGLAGALLTTSSIIIPRLEHWWAGPHMEVPGSASFVLAPGTYVLYEHPHYPPHTPDECALGGNCITVYLSVVQVNGPGGAISVESGPLEQITFRQTQYRGRYWFAAPVSGRYVVTVRGNEQGEIVVQTTQGQLARALSGWIALAILAALVGAMGIVAAIGSIWHRSRLTHGLGRQVPGD